MKTTTIDMIRHGEPVGGRRYRGQIDDPLSDKGWQQMHAAVGEHKPWDVIISSSLCRCLDFARQLSERHAIPLQEEPRLREIGFGEWEGKTAADIMQHDAKRLLNFWQSPLEHTPPGAETLHDFATRVIGAYEDILEQHRGKHVLLVGHAGQQRMVIRHVLAMPLEKMFTLNIVNAGISRIRVEYYDDTCFSKLVFMNGQL